MVFASGSACLNVFSVGFFVWIDSHHIDLHKVPAEFWVFAHFALLVSFAPSISVPNGLSSSFGAESYLASPSTVAKRLGVLPCIDRPGGVSETPHGKTNEKMENQIWHCESWIVKDNCKMPWNDEHSFFQSSCLSARPWWEWVKHSSIACQSSWNVRHPIVSKRLWAQDHHNLIHFC